LIAIIITQPPLTTIDIGLNLRFGF